MESVASSIGETETALDSVCAGQPPKKVVEGAILHCDEHDVINARLMRLGQGGGLRENRTNWAQERTAASRNRSIQEFSATEEVISGAGEFRALGSGSLAEFVFGWH